LILYFKGFQVGWVYELAILVVSLAPAAALIIKWLPSSAWSGPTRETAATDNGKKTSDSTSTEPVGQPGRGGFSKSQLANLANQKATPEELRDVAEKIQSVWDTVATFLDADLFTDDYIRVNRKERVRDGEFMQANAMLTKWSNAKHKGATRGRIIKAMATAKRMSDARTVFEEKYKHRGLVKYVCDQSK
jgi:hypothetical protein